MKRLMLAAGLAAVTATTWAAAPATTAPAASSTAAPVVSKQTHDDIMSLLQITLGPRLGQVTQAMSPIIIDRLQSKYRNITPEIAQEIQADIARVFTDPDRVKALEESLVPLYAQLYTDDEIRQIIAFGKTPAGAKMFAGTPNVQQVNEAMQPWIRGSVAPAIMIDTANILKKHNITINSDGTSNDSGAAAH